MALTAYTKKQLEPYLPARVLAFGYPDNIGDLNEGGSLTSIDLFKHRGVETIADLCEPLDPKFSNFDVVMDCGTIEHCSNPAQAFINAASAVKVGGIVFHHSPLNWVNHGYWNLCPQWFRDFYELRNRFEILKCQLTQVPDLTSDNFNFDKPIPWLEHGPYNVGQVPPCSLLLFIARRRNSDKITLPLCEPKWRP